MRKAQVVTRQANHIISILPQCAPDATGFLSDVYKRSTRARKFLADGVQCGRSMIEMQGVLAIIGVLSVGGIAGYSKAMEKFKLNKSVNQIITIMSNLQPYLLQKDHSLYFENKEVIGAGFIPDDMIIDENTIKNANNQYIRIYDGGEQDNSYITVMVYPITLDDCLFYSTQNWSSVFTGFDITNEPAGVVPDIGFDFYEDWISSDTAYITAKSMPVTPNKIVSVCQTCINNKYDYCLIDFVYVYGNINN